MGQWGILVRGLIAGLLTIPTVASAHGASLRGSQEAVSVPPWLFLLTGGAVVGASFLLASLVTDRRFVHRLHTVRRELPNPPVILNAVAAGIGFAGVGLIFWGGINGPTTPLRNVAILLVWVGWWPGFTMSTYLIGNTWPALNPARRLTSVLPTQRLDYPQSVGAWPAAIGILAVIFIEIVSPLATDPLLLVAVVGGYISMGVTGGFLLGDTWFRYVDPISRTFRMYGSMAPVLRRDGQLELAVPGAGLIEQGRDTPGGSAFVIALLWGTTYDGLVATPLFADLFVPLVRSGVPAILGYGVVLIIGYGVFYGAYLIALRLARQLGPTYRETTWLARRFAPTLIPIAAGYHFAHYAGELLALSPALIGAVSAPISPPVARIAILPEWFGVVSIGAILVGHLLAIGVAHGVAYESFPGRLQAVRTQAPLTAIMITYTIISLWIVTQPSSTPPFL